MSIAARKLMAAAGNGNTGPILYVEDVFSSDLFTGTAAEQSIINDVDLDGEGGLVWVKSRSRNPSNHGLFDTERGVSNSLSSNATWAESYAANTELDQFNSDGFRLNASANNVGTNISGEELLATTFRIAAGFFDVVTYTGDGTAGREISHNLGSSVGFIAAKSTSATGDWYCYHRSTNSGTGNAVGFLNSNLAFANGANNFWGNGASYIAPTDSVFTVGVSNNATGVDYVAYLFAHDTQQFGENSDDSIIKCGSFTTDGSQSATISLGWEPQYVLVKRTDGSENWFVFDVLRGFVVGGADARIFPNSNGAESSFNNGEPTADGFKIKNFSTNADYIYIAIRRPMKVPESGGEVFFPVVTPLVSGDYVDTLDSIGFNPDLIIRLNNGADTSAPYKQAFFDRLRGLNSGVADSYISSNAKKLLAPSTSAEVSSAIFLTQEGNMDFYYGASGSWTPPSYVLSHMHLKRAPKFMDVVCYVGTGAATAFTHGLKALPEFMIWKSRSSAFRWDVWHKDLGFYASDAYYGLQLNSTSAKTSAGIVATSRLTSTTWTAPAGGETNTTGANQVWYLFATLEGVSKVGSYTGTASSLDLEMGFEAGARFFLCKRTDSLGDWFQYDSARGIVAGNEDYQVLNTASATLSSTDYVDPLAAGLTLTAAGSSTINIDGAEYIYLAIA